MNAKLITSFLVFVAANLSFAYLNAQVTIGSGQPPQEYSILELVSTPIKPGGLRLPHLSEADKIAIATKLQATPGESKGLLIFNTEAKVLEYWDGDKWVVAGSGGEAIEPWMVSGTTDQATKNTDNIYQMGHVSIGASGAIDPTALLNVEATNKGVLLPRVELTSSTDQVTIPSPTVGLMVYNKGTHANFGVTGYMFWNGQEWRVITTSTSVSPNATLSCGETRLDPEQVITGDIAISNGTIMKIPYTLGNGGLFNGVVLESIGNPNVTATLANGQFENGSGYLAFYLRGTPTPAQSTPVGIAFDLTPFYTVNPTVDLGCTSVSFGTEIKADVKVSATIDNLKYTTDGGVPAYATQLTTPDGKFSVRAVIVSKDFSTASATFGTDSYAGMNLQVRNNTSQDVSIAGQFNWQWGGTGGNGANLLGLQPNRWSGDSEQNVDNATSTYWANYVEGNLSPITTGAPTTSNKTNRAKFIHWGNAGIYAGGRPERRTYSWTVNDSGGDKTAYVLTFSSSALKPNDAANAVNCPGGICSQTKIFMKIDQITAP